MLTVFAALVPVFLLIVLGFGLRRALMKQDIMWIGVENLVYYVLFPALLIHSLARANLKSVPILGVG
ncbi:transporter, partial [Bradyrhizobium japonicum]